MVDALRGKRSRNGESRETTPPQDPVTARACDRPNSANLGNRWPRQGVLFGSALLAVGNARQGDVRFLQGGCGALVFGGSPAAGPFVSGVPGALLVGVRVYGGVGVAILVTPGLVHAWAYQGPQHVVGVGVGVGAGVGVGVGGGCWWCVSSCGRWTLVRSGLLRARVHQCRGAWQRYGALCEVVVRGVGRDARDVVAVPGGRDRGPSVGLPPARVRVELAGSGSGESPSPDAATSSAARIAWPGLGGGGMAARDRGKSVQGLPIRGRWWCGRVRSGPRRYKIRPQPGGVISR